MITYEFSINDLKYFNDNPVFDNEKFDDTDKNIIWAINEYLQHIEDKMQI